MWDKVRYDMHRILLLLSCLFFFTLGGYAIGESPQSLIGSLDGSLSGLKKNTLDSIKSSLSSRYVEDFRTYGRDVAYDSLCLRIRVLVASNEHNHSDTLSKIVQVEQPLSEIDKLRQENRTLQNELSILKNGVAPEPELSPLEKRTRWIVKKLVMDNNEAADTLWKVYKDNSFGLVPYYFDSVPRLSFVRYSESFALSKPKYLMGKKYPAFRTGLEDKCQRYMIKSHIDSRVLMKLIGRDPSIIDYYNLQDYYDEMAHMLAKSEKINKLEVKGVGYSSSDLEKPVFRKPKDEAWSRGGKLNMQFAQYYVTDNWYKGGEPNATLLGIFDYELNYKEGKKFWDNDIDVKLGFYTSQNDTLRAFRVNNDVIKLTSTIGYETPFKKWFYAGYGEFDTQLFKNYKGTNSQKIKASFLSPTKFILSLGTKYQHNSNVYAYLSPLAYKLLFVVGDDIEDPKTVGIASGKAQNDFGLLGKGNLKFKLTKDININSTFDIFTPYTLKNVEMNWETVGNFVINRFLSTRLSLNMRFDSTPKSDDYESPKLQIQEQLSFGFTCLF